MYLSLKMVYLPLIWQFLPSSAQHLNQPFLLNAVPVVNASDAQAVNILSSSTYAPKQPHLQIIWTCCARSSHFLTACVAYISIFACSMLIIKAPCVKPIIKWYSEAFMTRSATLFVSSWGYHSVGIPTPEYLESTSRNVKTRFTHVTTASPRFLAGLICRLRVFASDKNWKVNLFLFLWFTLSVNSIFGLNVSNMFKPPSTFLGESHQFGTERIAEFFLVREFNDGRRVT